MLSRSSILGCLALAACAALPLSARAEHVVRQGTVKLAPGSQVTIPSGYTLHHTSRSEGRPTRTAIDPLIQNPSGSHHVLLDLGVYRMARTGGTNQFVGATIKVMRTPPSKFTIPATGHTTDTAPSMTVYPLHELKR